ncbi:MerR family transcriptional regulator [Saccharospirillum sp. HFRX-1]|uniref:MerR family transcriptional regulator n=1 Tax=unclassified Saccharospirillum TaxID=2633430 RepID=UPI00371C422A
MFIGELAKLAGLSKDGIRHYEELGIIRSHPRTAGSRTYRDYDASCLGRIEQARQAQQLGLSLKEIGPLLDTVGDRELSREETVEFLQERLAVVQEKINGLRDIERFIQQKLERYQPR